MEMKDGRRVVVGSLRWEVCKCKVIGEEITDGFQGGVMVLVLVDISACICDVSDQQFSMSERDGEDAN